MAEQEVDRLWAELQHVEQKIEEQEARIEAATKAKELPKLIASIKEKRDRLVNKEKDLRHQLSALQIRLATPSGAEVYPPFTPSSESSLASAPLLEQQSALLSLLKDSNGAQQFDGGLPLFLIDEDASIVGTLQAWLDSLADQFGSHGDSPLSSLFINGLVKTGKSYTLNYILPAVARGHPLFGLGGDREVLLCRLNFEELAAAQSFEMAVRRFLVALLNWAAGGRAAPSAIDRLAALDAGLLQSEIMVFMRTLPQSTMFLFDELQVWFLRPEEEAAMARVFLKALVVGTPKTAIFAFTGSSMCSVWANVAATAPNGISMLVHNRRCHLPTAVDYSTSSESWQFLQRSCRELPADLADYISNSLPAMQVYLAREFLAQLKFMRPSTEAELLAFVQEFEVSKLQMEVSKDFIPTLASLSPSQRLVLLHLVSDDGLVGSPDGGIAVLMAPYMETLGVDASGNDIMRLQVPWHASLIKSLINEEGEMMPFDLVNPADWTPLAYTSACEALKDFGEEVNNALKLNPSSGDLETTFKVMAADKACLCSDWWNAPWAEGVLTHPKCNVAARRFRSMVEQNQPKAALLAQLHVCVRHILAHRGMSIDVKKVVDEYPFADVGCTSQFLRHIAQNSPILSTVSLAAANSASTATSASSDTLGCIPASGTHSSSTSSAGTSSTPSSTPEPKRSKHGPRAPLATSSHSSRPSLAVSSRFSSGVQGTHLPVFQIAPWRPARSLMGPACWPRAVRPWVPLQIKSSILRYHAF